MFLRLAASAFAILLTASGDTLILKDGRRYTGIITADTGTVRIKVRSGKVYSFATAEVGKMEVDHPAPPEKQTLPRPAPGGTATTPQPERVANPPASSTAAEPAKVPPPTSLTVPEVGNTTSDSIQGASAIDSEFTARGSDNGVLGPPRAPVQPTADGAASVRFFTRGAIYWTSKGGAHAIYGPVLEAWRLAGGERSRLGFPTSDQQDDNAAYTRQQNFEHGSITWTQDGGAQIKYNDGAPQ